MEIRGQSAYPYSFMPRADDTVLKLKKIETTITAGKFYVY